MKDSNMFKCDLCHFNCQNKRTLFLHKAKTHFYEVKFKFKCNICRVGYSSRETYVQHVNIIHKDNGSRFKCIVKYKNQGEGNEIVEHEYECGKTFQILNSARRHLQMLHKIQTKDCKEAKKYFKIVTIKSNLFRPSKYSIYVGNQNQSNQNPQNENNEEVVSAVDDPDEILKILENNETDDAESQTQVLYSSENICIIEEKFIPDVTSVLPLPIDDIKINIDQNDKTDQKQHIIEKDLKKPFIQKLTGKSKVAVKKKKLVKLQSNKLTTKSQQVPKRVSLSRSCKNSVEILRQLDFETESENESESELFKSKSMVKVKSPKNVNKNKSSTRQQLVSESESDTDFEPEPEIKPKVKSSQKDKNQNSHSCHICQKKFFNPARLRRHLISNLHPENRVECTKCLESHYVVKGTLVEHHKDVKYGRKRLKNIPKFQTMPRIQHTCTRCHKVFDKRNLPRHLEHYCNVTEKKFKCKECNSSFTSYETYTRHLNNSSRHGPNRGKIYFCEQCSSGFTRAGSLKKHMQARHENDGTRFECKICCRSYGRYDSLLAHFKREEHKLREQDFQKKYQYQKNDNDNDNPIKIKKET